MKVLKGAGRVLAYTIMLSAIVAFLPFFLLAALFSAIKTKTVQRKERTEKCAR